MGILAGENGGAARHADGVPGENIFKEHPLAGEPVYRRGGVQRREPSAVGPDGMGGVIVGHDVENVRLFRLLLGLGKQRSRWCQQRREQKRGDEGEGVSHDGGLSGWNRWCATGHAAQKALRMGPPQRGSTMPASNSFQAASISVTRSGCSAARSCASPGSSARW